MSHVERIELGPETTPVRQGRSVHGRWRCAYHQAGTAPEEGGVISARLFVIQDADRLAFALTDGPAAAELGEQLANYLWTRETADDDWPQNLRAWLANTEQWVDLPSGRTFFVAGRMERNIAGGRIYLAWLGMNGVHLLDRAQNAITLDTVLSEDEAWTPQHGPEPVGMALHAYRGSLFGLDRLMIYTAAAAPVGNELADLSGAELQTALEDWSEEATSDLVIFDLRLNPVLTEPNSVIVHYHWASPDLCVLTWKASPSATGYRIEESDSLTFENASMVAELTDGRQVQYKFSPPASVVRYYRVVPMNQGLPGKPSEPVAVTPMTLAPPLLEPIEWTEDGGYMLSWSPIAQATGYEVQTAPASNFDPEESQIIYRGDIPEVHLPPDTPPSRYYRVRAINTLYTPHAPSTWSRPRRSPGRLPTPIFTQVTQERLSWEPIIGAHQYAIHVIPKDEIGDKGEIVYTLEAYCLTADLPATYRVRAFRRPNDERTASDWSDPVTISPPDVTLGPRQSRLRMLLPALIATTLVALLIGVGLGLVGLQAYQASNATPTRTPIPTELIQATTAVAATNIYNATTIFELTTTQVPLLETTIEGQSGMIQDQSATLDAQSGMIEGQYLTLTAQADYLAEQATLVQTQIDYIADQNVTLMAQSGLIYALDVTLQAELDADNTSTAIADSLTATAAAWTVTPSPTNTRRPTQTPNTTLTIQAAVADALTGTANAANPSRTTAPRTVMPTRLSPPTSTPRPSPTPTPTVTPRPPLINTWVEGVQSLLDWFK